MLSTLRTPTTGRTREREICFRSVLRLEVTDEITEEMPFTSRKLRKEAKMMMPRFFFIVSLARER